MDVFRKVFVWWCQLAGCCARFGRIVVRVCAQRFRSAPDAVCAHRSGRCWKLHRALHDVYGITGVQHIQ